MSRKRQTVSYALVFWTESNEISVLDSRCVIDEEMLSDRNKIGMVEFGEPSITAPPGGWPMFLGKVLAVSENEDDLRKLEDEFIEKGRLPLSLDANRSSMNTNKRKKTKANNNAVTPTTRETRTRRNSSMDRFQLIDRINYLEEELEVQKKQNEHLLRLNWQLQEDLPNIIEAAMKATNSKTKQEPPLVLHEKKKPTETQESNELPLSNPTSSKLTKPSTSSTKVEVCIYSSFYTSLNHNCIIEY